MENGSDLRDEKARRSSSGDSCQSGVDTCLVCMERPPDAVLMECGHGSVCSTCAVELWQQSRRCPLCREGFAGVMRLTSEADVGGVVRKDTDTDTNTFTHIHSSTSACIFALARTQARTHGALIFSLKSPTLYPLRGVKNMSNPVLD
jgi:hypothetical protein